MVFTDKDPDEIEFIGFNLATRLGPGETIQAATFTVAVVAGNDPAPLSMLQGGAVIDGSIVKQLLRGGVAGVHYRVAMEANTSAGQKMVEAGSLVVKDIG